MNPFSIVEHLSPGELRENESRAVCILIVMSFQSKLLKILFACGKAIRKDPSHDSLTKKRSNFEKIGIWMKPQKNTSVARIFIASVPVDEIIYSKNFSKTILYMHGGGFVYGGNKIHLHMLSLLSKYANARILAVDYSLSPENKYPTALNEVLAAYKQLIENGQQLYVAGDSAGANLALCLTIKLRDSGYQLPNKVILLSPSTDATFSSEWFDKNTKKDLILSRQKLEFFLDAYIPKGFDRRDSRISPIFAELGSLPPVLLHVGSDEIMFGDSYLVHEKILASGGESELFVGRGMWHVWHLFSRYMPESRLAIKHIAEFIEQ